MVGSCSNTSAEHILGIVCYFGFMYWQRIVLAVAIIALSLTMFVPMPVWAAVTLMVIALISAVLVVVGLLRSRR